MAVVVPAIGQEAWGDPLNNALLGLDAAIQGKADTSSLTTLTTQITAANVTATAANTTANTALTAAQNVQGTIATGVTPPVSPYTGRYWDDGTTIYRWSGSAWIPYPVGIGGVAASTVTNGSYTGQLRNGSTALERWDGSAWVPFPQAIGGMALAGTTTGSYVGQMRNGVSQLDRWDGSAWIAYPQSVGGIARSAWPTGAYAGQFRDGNNGTIDRWNGSTWDALSHWVDYTVVWTDVSGGTTPTFGNAVRAARYARTGQTCHFQIEVTFGSTTNFGGGGTSNNWAFSLPFTAKSTWIDGTLIGDTFLRATNAQSCTATALLSPTLDSVVMGISSGRVDAVAITNTGNVDAVSPWTWASTHSVRIKGSYEVA